MGEKWIRVGTNFQTRRMSLSPDKLNSLFPNASSAFRKLNARTGAENVPDRTAETVGPVPTAKRKSSTRKDVHREVRGAEENPGRYYCRLTNKTRRLYDEFNWFPKYHIDALRYAGAIHDDTPAALKLSVEAEQVKTKEEEGVWIEIYPAGHWPEGVK